MPVEIVTTVLLLVLAAVGATVGVAVAARGGLRPRANAEQREHGLLRVSAEVHTGWEQTLLGLMRELGLPRQANDLGYGQLYLQPRAEHSVYIRSRSEIGRGFVGEVEITPQRGRTEVNYRILRLPGDEGLHGRVLDLELDLIGALRRLDRHVDVRLAGAALREFDRQRPLAVEDLPSE